MAPRRKPTTALRERDTNIGSQSTMSINANGKRKAVEVVDLTASDDETVQPRKVPRPENLNMRRTYSQNQLAQSQSSQTQPSQSQRDPWDDDAENGVNEVIILSQDGVINETLEVYGTLHTKIVGLQYYTGYATRGEHVLVRREPRNQYDSNAIRVDNVQREQIGHIPRQIAAKLAPFIDAGDLMVEGVLAGHKDFYDCPIDLTLYGSADPAVQQGLRRRMRSSGLPIDGLQRKDVEAARRRAEELKKVAQKPPSVKNASNRWDIGSSQAGFTGSSSQGSSQGAPVSFPSMEDIMRESERFNPRELGQAVEKFGVGEDDLSKLPEAVSPDRLATSLLPYQRQALAWLLDRETPQLPPAGSKDVVQLWKRSPSDASVFTNIATNFSIKGKEPVLASGGILADDMGLGKTLEMIALIVADLASPPSGEKATATLIIAPLSVMSNWSGQIAQHVKTDNPLRVLTYHGAGRTASKPSDFEDYDVVITTYGTLATEYLPNHKAKPDPVPRKSGLFSMKWRRIVLDEGHIIRNPDTKAALAATNILAKSRWVLTGTPIINTLKDLYSLVKFIGLTGGLEGFQVFNTVLIRPMKEGRADATLLLQALMGTLCLRRRKDMKFINLRLPELSEYVHRIKFLPQEREKYDALQAQAKGLLTKYERGGKKALEAYRHVLETLLRMRQVCNHWKLCGERVTSLMELLEEQKVVELTPENRKALQDMLQLSIESREDCPICLEDMIGHSPVITHCAHIFGKDCITRVIDTQHKCPMCRAELKDETCLVQPAAEFGEDAEITIDFDTSSSKIEALLGILKASKPGTKTILFSQWTSFLDIVEKQIEQQGYKFTRIDGKMPASKRDQALYALSNDPDCTIMLASLGVCAVGLNLVAANQVVLMDSWWAPAIEDQAIDRVHRLGQTKPTTVFRLVMEDSIEERTLEIQADKRKLMMTAFQEKTNKRAEGKTARLADIQRLLR